MANDALRTKSKSTTRLPIESCLMRTKDSGTPMEDVNAASSVARTSSILLTRATLQFPPLKRIENDVDTKSSLPGGNTWTDRVAEPIDWVDVDVTSARDTVVRIEFETFASVVAVPVRRVGVGASDGVGGIVAESAYVTVTVSSLREIVTLPEKDTLRL